MKRGTVFEKYTKLVPLALLLLMPIIEVSFCKNDIRTYLYIYNILSREYQSNGAISGTVTFSSIILTSVSTS